MKPECKCTYCKNGVKEFFCGICHHEFNECESYHMEHSRYFCPKCFPKEKEIITEGNKMRDSDDWTIGDYIGAATLCLLFGLIVGVCLWGLAAGGRVYDVWAQGKEGEAELARAESNRQIKTLEAKASMESAKHLADAEVIRAKGVAEANKIIGDSLQGNEGYLRYLWIQGLQTNNMQVVYVPTECNLPILESTRLKKGETNEQN